MRGDLVGATTAKLGRSASVILAAQSGDPVDGILTGYPQLTAEDGADALAYYLQNRAEIDEIIARWVDR